MLSFFTHTKKGVLISFILFALFFSQCVKLNNDEPLVDNEPVGSTTTPSTESEVTGENTSSNTLSETTNVESPTTEQATSTTIASEGGNAFPAENPIVLAYFPSWSENWVTSGQGSQLRDIPPFVNHIFLGFGKPNLRYEKGSYDISETGIEVPYDGCALKESVTALRNKGINVILSLGGETYWRDSSSYNIDYQQIKNLVDDMGFAGIDWDFEPDGSFQQIGNTLNINRFITFTVTEPKNP